jgi:uncharacterized coiled-coil protein SlyX
VSDPLGEVMARLDAIEDRLAIIEHSVDTLPGVITDGFNELASAAADLRLVVAAAV